MKIKKKKEKKEKGIFFAGDTRTSQKQKKEKDKVSAAPSALHRLMKTTHTHTKEIEVCKQNWFSLFFPNKTKKVFSQTKKHVFLCKP